MSRLLKFPNPRRHRQEACAWVARIDAGLSDADRTALTQWLAESPAHARALFEMGRLWDDMDVMQELAELFPLNSSPTVRRPARGRLRLAAAVGALAFLAAAGTWTLYQSTRPVDLPASQAHSEARSTAAPLYSSQQLDDGTWLHETAIGGQGSIELADGSTVALNTNTRMAVRYSATHRVIELERGEATFNVAADPARPFDVYAGQRVVRALGTVFNVQLGPNDEIEVAVTEGRVRVLRSDVTRPALAVDVIEVLPVERVLLPGDAYFTNDVMSTVRQLEPEDIEVELAWQRGMLIFRGEPLASVLREVGRYTTLEFQLADPALAGIQVGGYFRAGEVDHLLVALQENFGIRATQAGNTITLAAH